MELGTYTAPEAATLAGVSYRRVDYWCRTGLIAPTRGARGPGSKRRFTSSDVADVAAVADALAAGLSLPEVRRIVAHAQTDDPGVTPAEALHQSACDTCGRPRPVPATVRV